MLIIRFAGFCFTSGRVRMILVESMVFGCCLHFRAGVREFSAFQMNNFLGDFLHLYAKMCTH